MSGTWKYSASQLATYMRCPRLWWLNAHGKRAPTTPAQQRGIDMHAQIARYLRDGVPPTPGTVSGRLASRLIPYLPAPGTANVEQKFEINLKGYKFIGYFDAIHNNEIYDHKTISDFRYIKPYFTDDPQILLYALASGYEITRLQWSYVNTRTYKTDIRVFYIKNSDARLYFQKFMDLLPKMNRDIEQPPNFSACRDYGGCYFRAQCVPDAKERIMSFLDEIEDGQEQQQEEEDSDEINLATASRDVLKAIAIARGLCDKTSKLGREKLLELLQGSDGAAPPPPPPPPAKKQQQTVPPAPPPDAPPRETRERAQTAPAPAPRSSQRCLVSVDSDSLVVNLPLLKNILVALRK